MLTAGFVKIYEAIPLITTARRAYSRYLWTNKSRTTPATELITMAPKRGDQPCDRRPATCGLRREKYRETIAILVTSVRITNGTGVFKNGMRAFETRPRRKRVTRSPRQEAIGGAMLSLVSYSKMFCAK